MLKGQKDTNVNVDSHTKDLSRESDFLNPARGPLRSLRSLSSAISAGNQDKERITPKRFVCVAFGQWIKISMKFKKKKEIFCEMLISRNNASSKLKGKKIQGKGGGCLIP